MTREIVIEWANKPLAQFVYSGVSVAVGLDPRLGHVAELDAMIKIVARCAIVLPIVGLMVSPGSAATTVTARNGMTVYVFDKDAGGIPACYEACAKKWPPYLAKGGNKMGEGWATVKRRDGSVQWTYDGKPLYFYAEDKKKGDKAGNGVDGVWHIVED